MRDPPERPALHVVRDAAPAHDDAELVRRVVAGRIDATRTFWDRYAPLIHGLAKRALGPGQDVDDVVQDAFVRLYTRLGQLRDPALLRSFVVTVAMNTIRIELRRRRVRGWLRLTDSGEVPEREGTSSPSAETALSRFYGILDHIGVEERACFVLRHFEAFEHQDIAAALDLSVATVKRRLERAVLRVMRRVRRDPFLMDFVAAHRLTDWERTNDG